MSITMMSSTPSLFRARPAPSTGGPVLSEKTQAAFREAYSDLSSQQLRSRQVAALPHGLQFAEVDATDAIQPTSHRHRTTLLVPYGYQDTIGNPENATQFYVRLGRSTNCPERTFGPFPFPPHSNWDARA